MSKRPRPDSAASDQPKTSRTDTETISSEPCPYCPRMFASQMDLQNHYELHHAHVCAQPGCGKVFPDPFFLGLHLDECHSVFHRIRRERGDKTFACFVEGCGRFFATPKTRRLHLVDFHKYPKEFSFALPNTGIRRILDDNSGSPTLLRSPYRGGTNAGIASDESLSREELSDGGHNQRNNNILHASQLPFPLHDESSSLIRKPSATCPSPNLDTIPLGMDLSGLNISSSTQS